MISRILIYASLIVLAVIFLLPLWVLIITSLKDLDEIYAGGIMDLPQNPSLQAWARAWGTVCVGLNCTGLKAFYANTFMMAIPSVFLSTFFGAILGYILIKWRFKNSELVFGLILFGAFMPFQAILIPVSQTLSYMGVRDPVLSLIIIHTTYGIPFTTLFFRNYYVTFPDELVNAALIDGAGFFRIFFKILLPVSTPIIVVAVIFQFTGIWNDFLFGVSFASGKDVPVTVALNNIVNVTTGRKQYDLDMAAAVLAALPTLLVYIVAGKYFLRGLTAGSVKG